MSDWKEIQDFRQFIENVTADDFDRTSAISELPPEPDFVAFRDYHIRRAEKLFESNRGEVDPMIALGNENEQRIFEADDDETMMDMFLRLQREATRMEATMVFIAMRLYASHGVLDINGLDGDEIRTAVAEGKLQESYCWYAEQTTNDGPQRASGIWQILANVPEGDTLGERTDGHPQVAPLFHMILNN